MRRKPSVLLLSILVHAAVLSLLVAADLWSPIAPWPVPHEVLAFSDDPRLVLLADIDLPRAPHQRAPGAPVASAFAAVPELAPVIASSGIAPETGREGGSGRTATPGIETTSGGAVDGIGAPTVPPPPPPQPLPVHLHSGIRTPEKIVHVAPLYPPLARASRVQGMVIIEATIDSRGHVESARILRSVALLDQAALDAVRQWTFTPTLLNGVAVPIMTTVTVNFKLE